jgi:hypothetical protein
VVVAAAVVAVHVDGFRGGGGRHQEGGGLHVGGDVDFVFPLVAHLLHGALDFQGGGEAYDLHAPLGPGGGQGLGDDHRQDQGAKGAGYRKLDAPGPAAAVAPHHEQTGGKATDQPADDLFAVGVAPLAADGLLGCVHPDRQSFAKHCGWPTPYHCTEETVTCKRPTDYSRITILFQPEDFHNAYKKDRQLKHFHV